MTNAFCYAEVAFVSFQTECLKRYILLLRNSSSSHILLAETVSLCSGGDISVPLFLLVTLPVVGNK